MTKPPILCLALQWLLTLTVSAATATYDTDGRLTRVIYADGSTIDYPRDSNGNQLDRIVTRPVELTLTVDPPGSGTVTGAGRFPRNTSSALTATAGRAFVFDHWSEGDTIVSTDPSLTFTVTTSHHLIAHFAPIFPTITTGEAIVMSATSATLSGIVSSKGLPTTMSFEYGLTSAYGESADATPSMVTDNTDANVTAVLSGLLSGARYHYRLKGTNSNGVSHGMDGTFTTPSNNANLVALTISNGTLTPMFLGTTTSYSVTVPNSVTSITVTPKVAQSGASLTVNGNQITSGTASGIVNLMEGSNVIAVTVTAQDQITTLEYSIMVTRANAAAGKVDASFDPEVEGTSVNAIAIQPDGKILIGGLFSDVEGRTRDNFARLNADGRLDRSTNLNQGSGPGGTVTSICLQPDDKILIAGAFGTVNGQVRRRIARFNPDGRLEGIGTFDPGTGANAAINCMIVQPDGKILIAGTFTLFNDQLRNRVARLNPNGSLESLGSFDPGVGVDGPVFGLALQPDGKIIIAGAFKFVNGQPRNGVARLNPDGSLEGSDTFNPGRGITGGMTTVYCVTVQADGKILLGGDFTHVNNQARSNFARLNSDGSVENIVTFNPGNGPNSRVLSIVEQADKKLLLGGHFTTVNGQSRRRIARVYSNGSLEGTDGFDAGSGPNNLVNGIAIQDDGKIVIGGRFTSVNGYPSTLIARLGNDRGTRNLVVSDTTQVQWLRGGATPETLQVSFDLSTNSGASWNHLGHGKRIVGGWHFTGLGLPRNGLIRARAIIFGGGNSSGRLEQLTQFNDLSGPEILVEQPAGVMLANGGTIDFGRASISEGKSLMFTIKNQGLGYLDDLTITKDGADEASFKVTQRPTAPLIGPHGSTSFTVEFTPSSVGAKEGALQIANNDPADNPFQIVLKGTGITLLEGWRLKYFGTSENNGSAADGSMPENDGITNLMKFATGMDPTKGGNNPGEVVIGETTMTFTYTRSKRAVIDGVSYFVEWSDTLLTNDWNTEGVSTFVTDQGLTEKVEVSVPLGASRGRFVRLRVSR